MSPVAELRSPPAVLLLLSCSCPMLHLLLHTQGHKHTSMQYNAHISLFYGAKFIVTPLGLLFFFYHSPTELWYVQWGLAAVCEHV